MTDYLIKNLIVWFPGKSEQDALDRLKNLIEQAGGGWNYEPLPDDPEIVIEEWDTTK